MTNSKVGIIYLCWADEPFKYLDDALKAITHQTYPRQNIVLYIIYNGPRAGEESQAEFIRGKIEERKNSLPETIFIESPSNIGFSAGNNLGMREAVLKGAEYILLHNSDGFLSNSAIEKLVQAVQDNNKIGVCQPLILLHPQMDLINSAGNSLHYLMVGYCDKYKKKFSKIKIEDAEIGYVSGAAAFMRADLIDKHGLWSEKFFLYHEDTEYSLRLRTLGYSIKLIADAVFYHKYEFANKPNKFFWIERNRHGLKLMYYKWPTLILLFPIELLFNFGLIIMSFFGGWTKELFKVYGYWFNPKNWSEWIRQRKIIQKNRLLSDRELLSFCTPMIFADDIRTPKVIELCANFVFTFYRFLLKIIIWW